MYLQAFYIGPKDIAQKRQEETMSLEQKHAVKGKRDPIYLDVETLDIAKVLNKARVQFKPEDLEPIKAVLAKYRFTEQQLKQTLVEVGITRRDRKSYNERHNISVADTLEHFAINRFR